MGLVQLLTNPGSFKFYKENQRGVINTNNVNPREIPFGNDRPGGGSSNQPYIKKGLLNDSLNPSLYNDFVLRGGILAPLSAVEDVARLTKYFADIKNPTGLLFTAKQNLLSRTGTKTEASKGAGYAGGALNEGAYTPLSTLAEAGVVFAGGHLNKQGIDPTGLIPGLGIITYQDAIKENQFNRSLELQLENNRLLSLTSAITTNKGVGLSYVKGYSLNTPGNDVLLSYTGGAGSNLGIGKTNVKFATDNEGNPIKTLLNFKKPSNYLVGNQHPIDSSLFQNPTGSSKAYNDYIKPISNTFFVNNITKNNGLTSYQYIFRDSINVYKSGSLTNTKAIGKGSWTQEDFINQPLNTDNTTQEDFRKILDPTSSPQNTFLSVSPSYNPNNPNTGNIEVKYNLGSPGVRGNRSSYTNGKKSLTGASLGPVDRVNASHLYKTNTQKGSHYGKDPKLNDIIPFYVAILNNDSQVGGTYKKYMHFRSYIDSFSDSYEAEWNGIKYMGRAEKFYKYGGFDRKISMAFTVVAQSREEITAMYDKLNFLASSLAPEYLDSYTSGYMAGNIAYITLGDYLVEQPGVITSLTFDVPEESTWEIGIDDQGNALDKADIRQMPHMIKVTGLSFIPIHKFRPEKQNFRNDKLGTDSERLLNTGKQQYLDQSRPEITNYDKEAYSNFENTTKKDIEIEENTIALRNEYNQNLLTQAPQPTNPDIALGTQSGVISGLPQSNTLI
jgi:hypothetical protein